MGESDLIAYIWQNKKSGEKFNLTILRGGQRQKIVIATPEL